MKNTSDAGAGLAPMACSHYIVRTTRLSVVPKGEPIFSEQCTHVSIEDEAAGEYLVIEQQSGRTDIEPQKISLAPEEWPALKNAIETLMADIISNAQDRV